jgi:hypothetical protein
MLDLYELPGPRRFIGTVAASIREGRNVVVFVPTNLRTGLFDSIAREVGEFCTWRRASPNLDNAGNPCLAMEQEYLGNTLEGRSAVPADIASLPQISGIVHHVVPKQESKDAWLDFIRSYERACREIRPSARPLFCIELPRVISRRHLDDEVCLGIHVWHGVVTPNDVQFFAESCEYSGESTGFIRRLISEVALRISNWDLSLCERLISHGYALVQDPIQIIATEVDMAEEVFENEDQLYTAGLMDYFEDGIKKHVAIAVHSEDFVAINRLLWRAQLVILLPFIEEQKIRTVQELGAKLKLPHPVKDGNPIEDAFDLEFGHLAYQVFVLGVVASSDVKYRIRVLRSIRNQLAHMKPIDIEQAFELERMVKNEK